MLQVRQQGSQRASFTNTVMTKDYLVIMDFAAHYTYSQDGLLLRRYCGFRQNSSVFLPKLGVLDYKTGGGRYGYGSDKLFA
jgi:hypothetical protein